jgi:hypothetical protein
MGTYFERLWLMSDRDDSFEAVDGYPGWILARTTYFEYNYATRHVFGLLVLLPPDSIGHETTHVLRESPERLDNVW